jgi:DNA-binding HxlR family transcriptional regulator
LLDLFGRRWTLRVLWELRAGPCSFRALQERCGGISPTVLNQRLREIRAAGLVTRADGVGYSLTAEGREVLPALTEWERWAHKRAH